MNFNNFTIKSQEVGRYAVEMAQSNGQQVVEAPHLLKSIMLKDEDITRYSIRGATLSLTPNNYSDYG